MSFNAKNLAYELKEPSFLRKLRSQHGGGDSARHERAIARPRREKDVDNDDDGPTYVDESSNNTLSKAEYEALVAADAETKKGTEVVQAKGDESEDTNDLKGNDSDQRADVMREREIVAGIGERKKRKAGKVVGTNESDDADDKGKSYAKSVRKTKKTKKVKLSFQDDQEDG